MTDRRDPEDGPTDPPIADTAAHHHLGLAADAVLRLGLMHVAAGTGGYRVIRAMKRSARALGFDRLDAVIAVDSITVTFHKGEAFRTVVAQQHHPGVNASRIEALEHLSHHLDSIRTHEALNDALDVIEDSVTPRWGRLSLSTAAGVACAGFAFLNHYPLPEAAAVGVAAFCGQFVRVTVGRTKFNQLGTTAVATATACLVYLAATYLVSSIFGVDPTEFSAGYVAAALFVIPGFPLFSALMDLARFDITAGITRLTYALSVIVTASITVSMVSFISGLNPVVVDAEPPTVHWYLLAALASFLGISGFAFLFNSSRRMTLIAASVGTVANIVRLVLIGIGVHSQFAALTAGLLIGLIAALAATRARIPHITVSVPAAIIMIPGTAMYRSMYHLNTGEIDQAMVNAVSAGLIVVYICAGLAIARMLTDRYWAFGKLIDFSKKPTGSTGPTAPGPPPAPHR